MSNPLLKAAIQLLFLCTGREKASRQAKTYLKTYQALADDGLTPKTGAEIVEGPLMSGVDEDMRRWSFYMLLEHNTLVNRSISALVQQLARGEPLTGPALINPQTDVLPSAAPEPQQLAIFTASIHSHLGAVKALGPLRGTRTAPHPLFGDFDAHQWHCLFALHLKIHLKQAGRIAAVAGATRK